jgi:SAM-dependent methyltransferase
MHPRIFRLAKWARALPAGVGEGLLSLGRTVATAVDIASHPWFIRDLMKYRSIGGDWSAKDLFPQLHDKTSSTPLDPHYFYQSAWAARLIHDSGVRTHHDVGSSNMFVGAITAFARVEFIDIRPLPVAIENLGNMQGTVLALPFDDQSIVSLSCLHVAEHIGLGRYGDPLDPDGTVKAARELERVLAPGGSMYFSLPVGRSRTQFNAHRITSVRIVPEMFPELVLVSLAVVDDGGTLHPDASVDGWDDQVYACGMFHFMRAH